MGMLLNLLEAKNEWTGGAQSKVRTIGRLMGLLVAGGLIVRYGKAVSRCSQRANKSQPGAGRICQAKSLKMFDVSI